jgi:hypothetical protein
MESSNVGQPESNDSTSVHTDVATFRTLSERDRKAIGAIVESKIRLKLAQAQVGEDVKALSERLGMTPAELNKIISLTMKERERGNVLAHERALIEVAEQLSLDGF